MPIPLSTTGDVVLDTHIDEILDRVAPANDRDLLRDILVEGVLLAAVDYERIDLKIVDAALTEMRQAFAAFAPVRSRRKLTVFGSARTERNDPLYAQASDVARQFAAQGWMVVTGAGPGIMEAAMEGAGRENSFGVRIRLPFETSANEVIAGDPKLVSMKYFFTRKLMLMKESSAYVAMPGGFGTLDETMELITLQQTGKAVPAPVVMVDVPGGRFWLALQRYLIDEVAKYHYVDEADLGLMYLCDSGADALGYVNRFYANFRSIRWFGDQLIIRLNRAPDDAQRAVINERFGALTTDGLGIVPTDAFVAEKNEQDDLSAERVKLRCNPAKMAELHALLMALNELVLDH